MSVTFKSSLLEVRVEVEVIVKRQEVLRQVADRLKEELLLPDNPKFKLSVSIPGWGGNPSIVQMDVKLRCDYAEVF